MSNLINPFNASPAAIARAKQVIQSRQMGGAPGTATPQQKILAVADKLGIAGMDVMQATTRVIYDSLPMTGGALVYKFFEGCNARAFPSTNLPSNRLEVGEALIVERMTLSTMTAAALPTVTATGTLTALSTSYYASEWSFTIANSVVVKPIGLQQLSPTFNKSSNFATHESYEFLSMICIPALQQFFATWQQTDATARANTYVKCTLEGIGVIYKADGAL